MAHKSSSERREQISEALLAVMAERGFAKASIARIAEEAGVTPGLIHYHFANKQAILLDVLRRLMEGQMERLETQLASLEAPGDKLDALIDAFLAVGDSADPDVVAAWVTISAEAIRQPEVRDAFGEALHAITGRVHDIIAQGVSSGDFDIEPLTIDACAAAIVALVQGYFSMAATAREAIPAGSAAPSARRMVAGLLGQEVEDDQLR